MSACPRERFPTLTDARTELAARRARATLQGTPRTTHQAYACGRCGGAHLRRATGHDTGRHGNTSPLSLAVA